MRRLRRSTAILLAVLSLGSLSAAGCGAVSHAVGGIIAHRLATHLVGRRNANKIFCLYHGHRLIVDLRNHHVVGAGINAYEAYRACKAGFGHGK